MASVEALPPPHAPQRRPPLWAVALTGALLAIGYRRREADGDGTQGEQGFDAGRGRLAAKPSDIPARGWKDILLRVYERISEDRILVISAGVTFYVLLAIFPAIAALVSIYGLFADPATVSDHLARMSGFLPGGAIEIVGEQMHRVATQHTGALGVTFIIGLAVSLWSANAGMKAVFDALNVVYEDREKRSFIKLNAVSLLFTLSVIVFGLLAIGGIVVLPLILDYLGLARAAEWLILIGQWPALFAAVMLIISLVYRYGPSRDEAQWRWITWGSAFAALVWLAASALFSWYAANFGTFNETYGSLGAAIGLMIWIWISTIVVLIGATLDAEMEHQTVRDTTTGPPQPLGQRGATKADTMAPARS
jgi:membrane protein